MNQQQKDDLEDLIEEQIALIESRNLIIDGLRQILVQQGDDSAILRQARVALSDWFIATYPHLYPGQGRPQLRVIQGGGEGTDRLF